MPLRFLTAGESHGPGLTAILDGMPAGLDLPVSLIDEQLTRRQHGYGAGPRMKLEKDRVQILGGIMAGVTTGGPISVMIENRDHEKWRGKEIAPFAIPRPGHADLGGAIRYGYTDLRPSLERASARETAARVAVGAICQHLLSQFGIEVGCYVQAIGTVQAEIAQIPLRERIELAEKSDVHCPDLSAAQEMRSAIRAAMENKDTLGGVLEIEVTGLPPGLGTYTQWDLRLEGRLGAAVLSVPAIKGVEIGPAFANARLPGTLVQDAITLEGDQLVRKTNRCGGLEGGITTGQPLVIRAAMKPIATTLTPQRSVDLAAGVQTDTHYERSDFCPVPRAVPILEAMVAFVLADALIEKIGGNSMAEMLPRFAGLRQAALQDLKMDGTPKIWWPE